MPRTFAAALAALVFVLPAAAGEWTGFGNVQIGDRLESLGEVKPQAPEGAMSIFARSADQEQSAKLGLASIRYGVTDGQVAAIVLTTASKESAGKFVAALFKSWGEPTERHPDRKLLIWKGEKNQLGLTLREDETAVLRLTQRLDHLKDQAELAREEAADEGMSSGEELEAWADEDMKREAIEREEQARREEAALAEESRLAKEAARDKALADEIARQQRELICGPPGKALWGTVMSGPGKGGSVCTYLGSIVPNSCC